MLVHSVIQFTFHSIETVSCINLHFKKFMNFPSSQSQGSNKNASFVLVPVDKRAWTSK